MSNSKFAQTHDSMNREPDQSKIGNITKNMNADDYYVYLLEIFENDREKIRAFMRGNGFSHTPFFCNSFASLSDEKQLDLCTKIANLNTRWIASGYIEEKHSGDDFMVDPIIREAYINSIVICKYYEQPGEQFWLKWAKEMRGCIFFVNPETLAVVYSGKLNRGAEVVTQMTKKMGINTQDVISNKISILDSEQRDTCDRVQNGDLIDIFLTSKCDGSLLVATSYIGDMIGVMSPVIDLFGSAFAQLVAKQSMEISNGTRLVVFSTQGTLIMGVDMNAYMITSMLVGSGVCSRTDLSNTEGGYLGAWNRYGSTWLELFMQFMFFDDMTRIQTFCFEGICASRRGLFNDHQHDELAISYEFDRFIFLGTNVCEKHFYMPHMLYRKLSEIKFEEPLWWNITDGKQVNAMISDIDRLIHGTLSKQEYLSIYPPANNGFDVKSLEQIDRAIIDCEGWVAMKIATHPIVDQDIKYVIDLLGIPYTIYSKIKTEAYYRAHKFRVENMEYLLELAKTAGDSFPLSRKIAGICANGSIVRRLVAIGQHIRKLLDFTDSKNKILPLLRSAFETTSTGSTAKNPLIGFEKRPFDVQCKIALNFRGFDFGILLMPIYLGEFPEINPETENLKGIFVDLTMSLRPWTSDYVTRINGLNMSSQCLQCLIGAIFA